MDLESSLQVTSLALGPWVILGNLDPLPVLQFVLQLKSSEGGALALTNNIINYNVVY